jgi:8-oxo-dGTP diphosphatase
VSIDVVLVSCHERRLSVLTEATGVVKRGGLSLPWGTLAKGEHLDAVAARIARRSFGLTPGWIEQAGAFADGTEHPGGAPVSVCYVAVAPWGDPPARWSWMDTHAPLTRFPERHRRMVTAALGALRVRLEQVPIAFFLLPREFTLSELQQT